MAQAWKLRIQSASFRGIPFQVYMAGGSLGRSTALHVFPNGSAPYPEDLGKAPQFYDVQGFVSGSSYMMQRDALEAAFQQPGPGYAGASVVRQPVCGTCRSSAHAAQRG